MSGPNDLYDSLQTLGDIQRLIDDEERECLTLEYKEAFKEWNDSAKREIAKDISAMANSEGGLIIFGVKTGKGQDKTKPIEITSLHIGNTDERLVQIVNSNIRNEIAGWHCKYLEGAGSKVLVVMVPRSDQSPHQTLIESRYYFRSETQNLRMNHHLVELHFGRRTSPGLKIEFEIYDQTLNHHSHCPTFKYGYGINIFVTNKGPQTGRDVAVDIKYPDRQFVHVLSYDIQLIEYVTAPGSQDCQILFLRNIVPGQRVRAAQLEVRMHSDWRTRSWDDQLMRWSLFAGHMKPKSGGESLAELGAQV